MTTGRDVTSQPRLTVAIVATVRNEYGSLPAWLAALANQSRLPDECIIVDGGSTDGTLEALPSADLPFPTRIVGAPGANISEGRNIAISRANADVVAVTDAGTVAEPDWLARLVSPLECDPNLDVAAGFFVASYRSRWTESLAAATLPDASDIAPAVFLPSSRSVAFRRRWFAHGFGYPEWLDYCEDVVFDLAMRRAGARQIFVPGAIVKFEPRRGPAGYLKQYFRYARGDGKAGLFWTRHVIRYATYAIAALVFTRRRPREVSATAVLGAIYIAPSIRRFYRHRRQSGRDWVRDVPVFVALIVSQRFIGDIAKMVGYPVGLAWRVRRDGDARLWKSTWVKRLPGGDLPPS